MNERKYSRRRLKIPFPCKNVVYLWNDKETHTGNTNTNVPVPLKHELEELMDDDDDVSSMRE